MHVVGVIATICNYTAVSVITSILLQHDGTVLPTTATRIQHAAHNVPEHAAQALA